MGNREPVNIVRGVIGRCVCNCVSVEGEIIISESCISGMRGPGNVYPTVVNREREGFVTVYLREEG